MERRYLYSNKNTGKTVLLWHFESSGYPFWDEVRNNSVTLDQDAYESWGGDFTNMMNTASGKFGARLHLFHTSFGYMVRGTYYRTIDATKDFTIEFWVKRIYQYYDRNSYSWNTFFCCFNVNTGNGFYLNTYDAKDTGARIVIAESGASSTGSSCNASNFVHFAFVFDKNNSILNVYVNGTLYASKSFTVAANQTVRMHLGNNDISSAVYVDEFRISNCQRYTAPSFTVPSAAFTVD